ncbi:hypothetical protein RUND412_003459 [Rhizina undulata]
MFKNFTFTPPSPPSLATRPPRSPALSPLTLCPPPTTDLPTPPLSPRSPRSLSPVAPEPRSGEQTLTNTLETLSITPPPPPPASMRQHRQQLAKLQTTDQQLKYLKVLSALLEDSNACTLVLPSPPEYPRRSSATEEKERKHSCSGPTGVQKGYRRDSRDRRRAPRRSDKDTARGRR